MSTSAELTNTQALSPAAGGVAEISSMTKGKHPLCQLSVTAGNLLDSLGFPLHTKRMIPRSVNKVMQLAFLCSSAVAAEKQVKPWVVMADWHRRGEDAVTGNALAGSFGRSRAGVEAVYRDDHAAFDLEWYAYSNRFAGAIAGTDSAYADTTDLIITGFRQWGSFQLIYGLESAAEEGVSFGDGFRWGLGAAWRWSPDSETDVALGLIFQDRFEQSVLPVPYLKAVWRPCSFGEVELRATGLQNGVIFRGYTEDRGTTVDFSVAYETLMFRLSDGAYGGRDVSVGEVPIRLGVTQFLDRSGTWFVRAQAEYVPFARHSFHHSGETMASFEVSPIWGAGARVGARF